jgi:sugar lactone lactonase YvrE
MRSTEAKVFFEPASEEDRYLPEGPRILPYSDGNTLGPAAWVNIQAGPGAKHGTLFVRGFAGANSIFRREDLPGRTGFLLSTQEVLRVLIGCEKELKVRSLGTGSWHTLATIPDENPRTIINDGEIVPGGKAVVFGTKDVQFKEPIANLYLYTVDDNRVSLLADGQTCSNGKVFATEVRGLILYDIDTPTRKVVRYRLDVAARKATPDGTALDLGSEVGFPDGMCDCGDGTVIVAFYNPDFAVAGRAVRYDLAKGKAIEEWLTPGSPRVTCPLLVQRPDGVKLILTTATEGMPADMRGRCPNAGCLFIADTQLPICPEPEVVRLPS